MLFILLSWQATDKTSNNHSPLGKRYTRSGVETIPYLLSGKLPEQYVIKEIPDHMGSQNRETNTPEAQSKKILMDVLR